MMKTTATLLCCMVLLAGCTKNEGEGTALAKNDGELAAKAGDSTAVPLSYEERQGSFLYARYCAVCHGERGGADGFNSYNLDPRPHSLADSAYTAALSDDGMTQVITSGGLSVNKSVLMPAYGGTLNSAQIRSIVAYMRTFPRESKPVQ